MRWAKLHYGDKWTVLREELTQRLGMGSMDVAELKEKLRLLQVQKDQESLLEGKTWNEIISGTENHSTVKPHIPNSEEALSLAEIGPPDCPKDALLDETAARDQLEWTTVNSHLTSSEYQIRQSQLSKEIRNRREQIEYERHSDAYWNAREHLRLHNPVLYFEELLMMKLRTEEFNLIGNEYTMDQFKDVYKADTAILDYLLEHRSPLYEQSYTTGASLNHREQKDYAEWAKGVAQAKLHIYGSNPPEDYDPHNASGIKEFPYIPNATRSWRKEVYNHMLKNGNPSVTSQKHQSRPASQTKTERRVSMTRKTRKSRRLAKLPIEYERKDDLEKELKRSKLRKQQVQSEVNQKNDT